MVSDGIAARCGTAFTPYEHYSPWNFDRRGEPVPQPPTEDRNLALNLVLHGLFDQQRLIELLRGYVAYAQTPGGLVKRIARAHHYFAVSAAVDKTVVATRGDGKAGVVWHTQGSRKSMEMELFAHQIMTHPALGNPTIVVLTDRIDIDDQLYDAFAASDLLGDPAQAVRG